MSWFKENTGFSLTLFRYSTHHVRTVTDFGHASHLKWPKSEAKRLSYGNFGTEITYLCTVTFSVSL